jgi:hypothetical protein
MARAAYREPIRFKKLLKNFDLTSVDSGLKGLPESLLKIFIGRKCALIRIKNKHSQRSRAVLEAALIYTFRHRQLMRMQKRHTEQTD